MAEYNKLIGTLLAALYFIQRLYITYMHESAPCRPPSWKEVKVQQEHLYPNRISYHNNNNAFYTNSYTKEVLQSTGGSCKWRC